MWELNPGPLEEQLVLSSVEPSLQFPQQGLLRAKLPLQLPNSWGLDVVLILLISALGKQQKVAVCLVCVHGVMREADTVHQFEVLLHPLPLLRRIFCSSGCHCVTKIALNSSFWHLY